MKRGDNLPGLPVQLVVWVMTKDRPGCLRGVFDAQSGCVTVQKRSYSVAQVQQIR